MFNLFFCCMQRGGQMKSDKVTNNITHKRKWNREENHLYHCLTHVNKEAKMRTATSQELPRQKDSLGDHSTTKQSLWQQIHLEKMLPITIGILPSSHQEAATMAAHNMYSDESDPKWSCSSTIPESTAEQDPSPSTKTSSKDEKQYTTCSNGH